MRPASQSITSNISIIINVFDVVLLLATVFMQFNLFFITNIPSIQFLFSLSLCVSVRINVRLYYS